MSSPHFLALVLALAVCASCGDSDPGASMAKAAPAESGSNPDVNAQIEGAVRKHLSRRGDLDMSAMDMGIEAVEVNGDEADATVSFRVKGTPEAAMSMKYHLIRQAGAWVVQPNAAAGHGATPPPPRGLPPGHPPAGGQQPAQPLPPGHPPVAQ